MKMANTCTEIVVIKLLKVMCAFYLQIHVYLRNISIENLNCSNSTAIVYLITEELIGTDYGLNIPQLIPVSS